MIYETTDSVILQCDDIEPYLSQYIYLNSTGFGLATATMFFQVSVNMNNLMLDFYPESGQWQLVYYETNSIIFYLLFD